MPPQTNFDRVLEQLRKVFAENADKRICVVGASCIGKTTLLRNLPECLDCDDVVWSKLPKDVYDLLKKRQEPWDEDTLDIWKEWFVKTDFDIKPGHPLFSVWIEEPCDLVIYLDLNENKYIERVVKRKKNIKVMLNSKAKIEKVVKETKLPVITIDMDSPIGSYKSPNLGQA